MPIATRDSCHAKGRRRQVSPGFKLFAVFERLRGIAATSTAVMWRKLGPTPERVRAASILTMIATLEHGKAIEIPTEVFPADGSFMRRSQVAVFCTLFGLDEPGPILKEIWSGLDTVVIARNDIAHGTLPADEVGRLYSLNDMLAICYLWKLRWTEFLDAVERQAALRDFYRRKR